jgi:hypothetical protein
MLRSEVCAFLRSEGHEPTLTVSGPEGDYGHVRFRARGNRYVVHTIEDDQQFLHLTASFEFPMWRLDSAAASEALFEAQRRLKVIKFSLGRNGESVTIHAEQFTSHPPTSMHYRIAFWRAIDAIDEALEAILPRLRVLDSPRAAAHRFIDELTGLSTSNSSDD